MHSIMLGYAMSLGNAPDRNAIPSCSALSLPARPLGRLIRVLTYAILAVIALLALTGTAGCTSLQNQVEAPRDNTKLSRDVSEQIFADGIDSRGGVQVNSQAGVVTLTGQTATNQQANRIAASAGAVPGVMRVENRLRVSELTETGEKNRRTLIEDVRQALETSLPIHGPDLLVEADDGVVYLTGIVPNEQIEAAAVAAARNVQGVHDVADNMIAEQVERAVEHIDQQ